MASLRSIKLASLILSLYQGMNLGQSMLTVLYPGPPPEPLHNLLTSNVRAGVRFHEDTTRTRAHLNLHEIVGDFGKSDGCQYACGLTADHCPFLFLFYQVIISTSKWTLVPYICPQYCIKVQSAEFASLG